MRAAILRAAARSRARGDDERGAARAGRRRGPRAARRGDRTRRCDCAASSARTAPAGRALAHEVLLRARAALDKGDLATAATAGAREARRRRRARGRRALARAHRSARRALPGARTRRGGCASSPSAATPRRAGRSWRARSNGETRRRSPRPCRRPAPLSSPERITLAALAGLPIAPDDPHLDAAAAAPGMQALAAGVAAPRRARRRRPARPGACALAARRGVGRSRELVRLGRLLAAGDARAEVEETLAALGDAGAAERPGPRLEMAVARRTRERGERRRSRRGPARARRPRSAPPAPWPPRSSPSGPATRSARSTRSRRRARADPTNEAALRAIASLEQVDLVGGAQRSRRRAGRRPARRPGAPRGRRARRGRSARADARPAARARAPRGAHPARSRRSWPSASRAAPATSRRCCAGSASAATNATDAIEAALDGVREALLVADRDPALAAERLHEAHRARPSDVALRELYERMTTEPPDDRRLWREQRAAAAEGDARALLFLEAAHEYERAGDEESRPALRRGGRGDRLGARSHRARARRAAQRPASRVSPTSCSPSRRRPRTPRVRREAYERLAVPRRDRPPRPRERAALAPVDPRGAARRTCRACGTSSTTSSARDATRSSSPWRPASRAPCAARAPASAPAHAELAARLRMRGAEGELGAHARDGRAGGRRERALALVAAHAWRRTAARAATTRRSCRRRCGCSSAGPRPSEAAALLARAGEAASRLGRLDEARALLERAAVEDPGDVVAWGLLADVRQRAGDARGAAEACESLARSSMVRDHQLLAWYDAGRIWPDDAQGRGARRSSRSRRRRRSTRRTRTSSTVSSRLYATRKMQPELAALLERRLEGITDPDERLAMEVRRGRVLLEVGDTDGARAAFEAALAQRPDDAERAVGLRRPLRRPAATGRPPSRRWCAWRACCPRPRSSATSTPAWASSTRRTSLNLSRAEVALKEVLKRAPDDVGTAEKLVDVYRRQNDPARAIELQQELVGKRTSPEEKRHARHRARGHPRADGARQPQGGADAGGRAARVPAGRRRPARARRVLHAPPPDAGGQHPARPGGRRRASGAGGRAVLAGPLRGARGGLRAARKEGRGARHAGDARGARGPAGRAARRRGARVRPAARRPAGARGADARRCARCSRRPATRSTPPRRSTSRALRATAMSPESPIARIAIATAQATGLPGDPGARLAQARGRPACPSGSAPPTLVLGEALLQNERPRSSSSCGRSSSCRRGRRPSCAPPPASSRCSSSAWLKVLQPHAGSRRASTRRSVNAMAGRIQAALPRNLDPDVGVAGARGRRAASARRRPRSGTARSPGATASPCSRWGTRRRRSTPSRPPPALKGGVPTRPEGAGDLALARRRSARPRRLRRDRRFRRRARTARPRSG